MVSVSSAPTTSFEHSRPLSGVGASIYSQPPQHPYAPLNTLGGGGSSGSSGSNSYGSYGVSSSMASPYGPSPQSTFSAASVGSAGSSQPALYKAEMTDSQVHSWQQQQQQQQQFDRIKVEIDTTTASFVPTSVPSATPSPMMTERPPFPPSSPVPVQNTPTSGRPRSPVPSPYYAQSQYPSRVEVQPPTLAYQEHSRHSSTVGATSPRPSWNQPPPTSPTTTLDTTPASSSRINSAASRPYEPLTARVQGQALPSGIDEQSSLTEIDTTSTRPTSAGHPSVAHRPLSGVYNQAGPLPRPHQQQQQQQQQQYQPQQQQQQQQQYQPQQQQQQQRQQQRQQHHSTSYPSAIESQSSLTEIDSLPFPIEAQSALTEIDSLPHAVHEQSALTEIDSLPHAIHEQSALTEIDELPHGIHEQSSLTELDHLPHALHEQSSLTEVDSLPHSLSEQSSLTVLDEPSTSTASVQGQAREQDKKRASPVEDKPESEELSKATEPASVFSPLPTGAGSSIPTDADVVSSPDPEISPASQLPSPLAEPSTQPTSTRSPAPFSMSNWMMPSDFLDTNEGSNQQIPLPVEDVENGPQRKMSMHTRSAATMAAGPSSAESAIPAGSGVSPSQPDAIPVASLSPVQPRPLSPADSFASRLPPIGSAPPIPAPKPATLRSALSQPRTPEEPRPDSPPALESVLGSLVAGQTSLESAQRGVNVSLEVEELEPEEDEDEGNGFLGADDGVSAFIRELESSMQSFQLELGESTSPSLVKEVAAPNDLQRNNSSGSRTSYPVPVPVNDEPPTPSVASPALEQAIIPATSSGPQALLSQPLIMNHTDLHPQEEQTFEWTWSFTENEKETYERIFSLWERPAEDCVSADIAGKVYMTVGLPTRYLPKIMVLVNPEGKQVLTRTQFISGLHLVHLSATGSEIPEELPEELMTSAASVGRIMAPARAIKGPSAILSSAIEIVRSPPLATATVPATMATPATPITPESPVYSARINPTTSTPVATGTSTAQMPEMASKTTPVPMEIEPPVEEAEEYPSGDVYPSASAGPSSTAYPPSAYPPDNLFDTTQSYPPMNARPANFMYPPSNPNPSGNAYPPSSAAYPPSAYPPAGAYPPNQLYPDMASPDNAIYMAYPINAQGAMLSPRTYYKQAASAQSSVPSSASNSGEVSIPGDAVARNSKPGPHALHDLPENAPVFLTFEEETVVESEPPQTLATHRVASPGASRMMQPATTPAVASSSTARSMVAAAPAPAVESSAQIEANIAALYASPPDAWDHDAAPPELDVDGNYIKYRSDFKNDMTMSASVTGNHPINPKSGVFYFEITIDTFKGNSALSVGIASKSLRRNCQVGWDLNSWGYHSDDGFLYFGNGKQNIVYSFKYGEGDTIGCGINFVDRAIFFTMNGDMMGVAFRFIKDSIPLYPAVGLSQSGTEINANFGDQTFMFNIVEYKKAVLSRPMNPPALVTWNTGSKNGDMFHILSDGLSVISSLADAGCIRGPKISPREKDVFYFEVTILYLPKAEMSTIMVGICGKNQSMKETLGWKASSYGYSGESGDFLSVSSTRSSMNARSQSGKMKARARGPPFRAGSVVGCGVDFAARELFFTLNGECLGQAFYEVDVLDCFPCVSVIGGGGEDLGVGGPLSSLIREQGSSSSSSSSSSLLKTLKNKAGFEFKANFGQQPFLFDLNAFESSGGQY
ncbi:hypothetical protein BGW38_003828 [Lunasporangiospora selenospora]|uniref:SPRY domain-containing protein n=1 Tax=Lunasporangiospora selenospora TaxID=979761 RepID=A0A9P6G159_9FUNG|nr:hypothetical protein BGW38_003828 [Lunasporangiospora selenospora]